MPDCPINFFKIFILTLAFFLRIIFDGTQTLDGWGGAGVIVTEGERSLTPGGKPEGGRPKELLCGG